MLRFRISVLIALGALVLGVMTALRGQFWLGMCFIGIALLRASTLLWARKPRKPEPEIRLNLEDEAPPERNARP